MRKLYVGQLHVWPLLFLRRSRITCSRRFREICLFVWNAYCLNCSNLSLGAFFAVGRHFFTSAYFCMYAGHHLKPFNFSNPPAVWQMARDAHLQHWTVGGGLEISRKDGSARRQSLRLKQKVGNYNLSASRKYYRYAKCSMQRDCCGSHSRR